MVSPTQKIELKRSAEYIKQLPKIINEWAEIRRKLAPGIASSIEGSWNLLGLSLDAFFSDIQNPIPSLNLEEGVEKMIQNETQKYLSLSILLFQAEPFLREEALAQGIEIENFQRSDFVKIWALEGCICEIILYSQFHWEGYSQAQWDERRREAIRHATGEIEDSAWDLIQIRWNKEDSKLSLGSPSPESCMPFSKFCIEVFQKNRSKLGEFPHFTELWLGEDFPLKTFIINGESKESKRRRRGF